MSTALRKPRESRDLSDVLLAWGERAVEVLGVVVNVAIIIWMASGFLFTACWVIALIVGVFLGDD